MRTHLFLYFMCLYSSSVVLVTCNNGSENIFSMEKIRSEGINFMDIVQAAVNLDDDSKCLKQINTLRDFNPEALYRMADSWSKFPYTGAFYVASRSDYGNYDECIKIDVKTETDNVLGKFCVWGWGIPDYLTNGSAWKLSYCIPDKCTSQDLYNVVQLPLFNDLICSTKDTDSKLDVGAIVTIVLLANIIVVMVLSTAYDVFLFHNKQKPLHDLFTAFSVLSNGKKLLAVTKHSKAKDQVLCFNGMKFISMWWIISGHGFLGWFLSPLENDEFRAKAQETRVNQYITTAHISVDTFFYISGFLMSYLYFKHSKSKATLMSQVKVIPSMIVHRYLRLTPANGMCFLVSVYLLKYFNDGPFYSYGIHKGLIEPCEKYWWSFFLYIQNYYNYHINESLCIPTTWYLSADMQLFLISPLIIMPISILYKRSFITTMAALFVLNSIFFVIPIFTKLQWQDYDPDFHEYDFHGKLISYFIGVMMGIYMRHEVNKKFVIPKILNVCLWFLSLSTMFSVMWYRGEIQINWGYVAKSLCYSITRPMWCISLCWITYACTKGYGGVINWFLSCGFMQLGAKLTYCLYIVHGLVIANYGLGLKYRYYLNNWTGFYVNCGHFIVSMIIATFWTLAFELPMITIEKFIFGQGKARRPRPRPGEGHENPQKVT